ncbi:TetR/AcrR family transcriptional regulator [Dactylosporangium sp. NPDC051485]|uniref:TetR/AcrR family transcriptional regulator n=1 Tax=Dactylosporangium sp. NPDC051485 TaxID=3154846 RepID=UPI0034471F71
MSRERIAAEAVALLDEEQVGGLTMRRLADRLDAGLATLYWHVATKDEVVDLALDEIFGEVRLPAAGVHDWQDGVRILATEWRATMLRHPWSAALLGRPLLGPNVLARTEYLHSTLLHAGLREPHLSAATHAVANYVIGSALTQSTWRLTDASVRRAAQQHLHAQRDVYPTLADHGHLDDKGSEDTRFDNGLTYVINGIEAIRAGREPAAGGDAPPERGRRRAPRGTR